MCKGDVYSPKIRENLIPVLYRLAKVKKIPMTVLVNEIIEDYLTRMDLGLKEMGAREAKKNRPVDESFGNRQGDVRGRVVSHRLPRRNRVLYQGERECLSWLRMAK